MEFNKIFASILLAGIIAMMAGFISRSVVHVEKPHEEAYVIEAAETTTVADAVKAGPEPILALIASADVSKGEKLSKACAACHSFDKGGANKVGPNLWGVVNAAVAVHDGFAYSDALKAKNAEGVKWTYDQLNEFLYKPKAYAPGTKMSYIGMKKQQDRADMVAWLRTLSDSPAALPEVTAEEEAEEESEEAPAAE
jgi:cytochrome c